MVTVPGVRPVTSPVNGLTEAYRAGDVFHVPPGSPSVSVMTAPAQTDEGPAMGAGAVLTVMVMDIEQPAVAVKVMSVVPGMSPVTTPEAVPIVATEVLLLVQEPPPDVPSVNRAGVPMQTFAGPMMGAGAAVTVTGILVAQPVPSV